MNSIFTNVDFDEEINKNLRIIQKLKSESYSFISNKEFEIICNDNINLLNYSSTKDAKSRNELREFLRSNEERLIPFSIEIPEELENYIINFQNGKYKNLWENYQLIKLKIEEGFRHIIVNGLVKVGKLEIEKTISKLKISDQRFYKIIHITKLFKKDMKEQIRELEMCGIVVHQIQNKESINKLCNNVNSFLNNDYRLLFFIDESDFGTGSKHLLAQFYKNFMDNDKCKFIYISATNEEILNSSIFSREDCCSVDVIPGKEYHNISECLESGKVFTSIKPFIFNKINSLEFNDTLKQAIIKWLSDDKKSSFVLRLPSKSIKENSYSYFKDFFNRVELKELCKKFNVSNVLIRYAEQRYPYHWGSTTIKEGKELKFPSWLISEYLHKVFNYKTLVIVNQTCNRATRVCWEPFHTYYCYSHNSRDINTIKQETDRWGSGYGLLDARPYIYTDPTVIQNISGRNISSRIRKNNTSYLQTKDGKHQIDILGSVVKDKAKDNTETRNKIISYFQNKYNITLDLPRVNEENRLKIRLHNSSTNYIDIIQDSIFPQTYSKVKNVTKRNSMCGKYIIKFMVFVMDGPNISWEKSWDFLKNKYPEYIDKEIIIYTIVDNESGTQFETKSNSMYHQQPLRVVK